MLLNTNDQPNLYIRTVTSTLHINIWYLISPCRTTMLMDSELCSYRYITRQLEKRYNINKMMMISSWYGITNLLHQFFNHWTIRHDEHSLTDPSFGRFDTGISSPLVCSNDWLSRLYQCLVDVYYRWLPYKWPCFY